MSSQRAGRAPGERSGLPRNLSEALRAARSREEQETLLGDEEQQADQARFFDGRMEDPIFTPNPHASLPVYTNIHRIRRLVLGVIDDPYSIQQLQEPRINVLIVRPLVDRLYDPDDISIVYCLLVNRAQFLREQSYQSHHQTVNITRANLCELIAGKILRRFDEENPGKPGLLLLANTLVAGFEPFQNAPPDLIPSNRHALQWAIQKRGGYERKLTALEIAIISESKHFLSGSACQKVVDAIYRGRIIYTPTSFMDILPDYYKHKRISLYDPRKGPLLNQYRLIVPRTRNFIELAQFALLLVLYSLCMYKQDHTGLTGSELVFWVYGAGWVLDEFASVLEHGWHVHTQNLWSFLDITFVVIFTIYSAIRIHGLSVDSLKEARQALDILAMAAPVLLPRLAFCLMPENLLFISLRAMMGHFMVLTLLAAWCFAGFLLALRWLSTGNFNSPDDAVDPITISKWMLWIWFGLDGTGINEATSFHMILGPVLMVVFAFMGNTLFLTVLVSILTDTFSKLAADATAEIQFRRTVLTFEGVKSDAIFAYRPPFNILAVFVLLPIKFVISPRWFHKINVTLVRIQNAPILAFISWYERRSLWKPARTKTPQVLTKRSTTSWWSFSNFSPHRDIQTVFDIDPPQNVVDQIDEEDEINDDILENSFAPRSLQAALAGADKARRRWSSVLGSNL